MARLMLRSSQFRHEREESWKALEEIVGRIERRGIRSLSANEALHLPGLYRSVLSSLSVAREISLDRNLLEFLESLSARAYFCVYGVRSRFWQALSAFFGRGFPAAVWGARYHVLVAFLCLLAGAVTGYVLTIRNPEWFYAFVSEAMASGRTPASTTDALRETLYGGGQAASDGLAAFASFLFGHNARIGMLAFALGFAFGVPVILLLFYNGAVLGAFTGLFASRGLGVDIWAWLLIHGTTELFAVVLCGAAGLMLGSALAFPGRSTRLANLAHSGRQASRIVMGAVAMFFIAGLLEGFGRQMITDPVYRYAVGGGAFVWWLLYFRLRGAGGTDGE